MTVAAILAATVAAGCGQENPDRACAEAWQGSQVERDTAGNRVILGDEARCVRNGRIVGQIEDEGMGWEVDD